MFDRYGGKAAREPVSARRERHPCPLLPVGDVAADSQRPRLRFQDGRSDPFVDSQPGVEEESVRASPRRKSSIGTSG